MAAPPSSITPRRLSIGLYALTLAVLAGGGVLAAGALRSGGPQAPLTASLSLPAASQAGPAAGWGVRGRLPGPGRLPGLRHSPAAGAAPVQQPAAPETPVNAVVVGIIMRGNVFRAVVEVGSTGQKLLRVGDPLDGGRIAEITITEVVLERTAAASRCPSAPPAARGLRRPSRPCRPPRPRAR